MLNGRPAWCGLARLDSGPVNCASNIHVTSIVLMLRDSVRHMKPVSQFGQLRQLSHSGSSTMDWVFTSLNLVLEYDLMSAVLLNVCWMLQVLVSDTQLSNFFHQQFFEQHSNAE